MTEPPNERDLTELTSFTKEMNRRGLDPQTKLIEAESREADEAAVRRSSCAPALW